MTRKIALECKIEQGGFPYEKLFRIPLDKGEYIGGSAFDHCWYKNGEPFTEHDPKGEQAIEGIIAARIIDASDTQNILVAIPNGETIRVSKEKLLERPGKEGYVSYRP